MDHERKARNEKRMDELCFRFASAAMLSLSTRYLLSTIAQALRRGAFLDGTKACPVKTIVSQWLRTNPKIIRFFCARTKPVLCKFLFFTILRFVGLQVVDKLPRQTFDRCTSAVEEHVCSIAPSN